MKSDTLLSQPAAAQWHHVVHKTNNLPCLFHSGLEKRRPVKPYNFLAKLPEFSKQRTMPPNFDIAALPKLDCRNTGMDKVITLRVFQG